MEGEDGAVEEVRSMGFARELGAEEVGTLRNVTSGASVT